jgi:hypothetical protein
MLYCIVAVPPLRAEILEIVTFNPPIHGTATIQYNIGEWNRATCKCHVRNTEKKRKEGAGQEV